MIKEIQPHIKKHKDKLWKSQGGAREQHTQYMHNSQQSKRFLFSNRINNNLKRILSSSIHKESRHVHISIQYSHKPYHRQIEAHFKYIIQP